MTLAVDEQRELINSFLDTGFCVVERAFTHEQAERAAEILGRRIEQKTAIRRTDPSTWPASYDIEEHLDQPEVISTFTDRLAAAIEVIEGPGKWRGERRWGLWPVNFSVGADLPWDFPSTGYHVDGNYFLHTLTGLHQGLLVIGLFTDIEPTGGGTILAAGSHRQTARVLAKHATGIPHRQLFEEVLATPIGNFHEVTGQAGDVVLAHPFLFHTRGMKHLGPPRIISNTEAALRAPMNLNRPDPRDYSPLELSIIDALTTEPDEPVGARLCRF
jgi:hypothetical protein